MAGKRIVNAYKTIDKTQAYALKEAVKIVKSNATAKFDETIDVAINLGVDPKHADQMIRGVCALPHGTGKTVRVAVLAQGEKADEAKAAGADIVGAENLIDSILAGKIEFDRCIATPDMMGIVGRLGKVLGPKGLMPSPKAGTVTPNVGAAVKEIKAGKVEYRLDKTNIIHCPIGKVSFGAEKLSENMDTLLKAVVKAKPAAAKGQYIKSCTVVSTMGPGVKVSTAKYL